MIYIYFGQHHLFEQLISEFRIRVEIERNWIRPSGILGFGTDLYEEWIRILQTFWTKKYYNWISFKSFGHREPNYGAIVIYLLWDLTIECISYVNMAQYHL